jgi:hypothetical protein
MRVKDTRDLQRLYGIKRAFDATLVFVRRAAKLQMIVTLFALGATECSPRQPVMLEDVLMIERVDVANEAAVPVDPCGPAVCGPVERCGPTNDSGFAEGNGVDDDCNGRVDETCRCRVGTARSCYVGTPDRRGLGACRDGMMLCGELGTWLDCTGSVGPTQEVCNNTDDDCDGMIDEGLVGCDQSFVCPAFVNGEPLRELVVDGASIAPGASSFRWSLECPAEVMVCPTVTDPSATVFRFLPAQAGRYIIRTQLTRASGQSGECVFPAYIDGKGLRVELSWDTQGGEGGVPGADLDLHVAPIERARVPASRWFSLSDCYYASCRAAGGTVRWGLDLSDLRWAPTMDVSRCQNAPPPWGELWRNSGRCWNPRLDTDTVQCDPSVRDTRNPHYCFVENFAVDLPTDDVTYRVMVNYYQDHGTCADRVASNDVSHPHLFVYCGAGVRAELGAVDSGGLVSMSCRDNQQLGSVNWSWLAADVHFVTNGCGVRDCVVVPLSARRLTVASCASVSGEQDLCKDRDSRLFVRRSGARPVDAELADSF